MKKTYILTVLTMLVLLAITIGSVAASESKTVFRTLLSAAPNVESDAHGNAVFKFNNDGSAMKYKLVVNGLDKTTMAHIHVSDTPCTLTPPVLWLYPDTPPLSLIGGTFNGLLGGRTVTSGDLFQADDLRGAIEDGRAYVLVHTANNPPGEICGVIE